MGPLAVIKASDPKLLLRLWSGGFYESILAIGTPFSPGSSMFKIIALSKTCFWQVQRRVSKFALRLNRMIRSNAWEQVADYLHSASSVHKLLLTDWCGRMLLVYTVCVKKLLAIFLLTIEVQL